MSAAAVARDQPFAPGAVVLSFACFSAGVPAQSVHAFLREGREAQVVDRPMTAALPRALLAHPRGRSPSSATSIAPLRAPSTRTGAARPAFQHFLDWTLADDVGADRALATLGSAMDTFRREAGFAAQNILSTFTLGARAESEELISAWVRYYDAVGYLLLGDPALSPSSVLAKSAPPP